MIGKNIANYRKLKGLTQTELAKIVGISKGHLAAIEKGKRQPKIIIIARIAAHLNISIQDLLKE